MMAAIKLDGGCLCGAIRYRLSAEQIDAGYCHCRLCQRSSGAPVMAWATFAATDFSYTRGVPTIYRSSPQWLREFCSCCGTQLVFRRPGETTVDVAMASLDDTAAIAPEYHIWTTSRIAWFETRDELPRHATGNQDEKN
jgi:hypothetical protein